jgi:hypothetical protein
MSYFGSGREELRSISGRERESRIRLRLAKMFHLPDRYGWRDKNLECEAAQQAGGYGPQ